MDTHHSTYHSILLILRLTINIRNSTAHTCQRTLTHNTIPTTSCHMTHEYSSRTTRPPNGVERERPTPKFSCKKQPSQVLRTPTSTRESVRPKARVQSTIRRWSLRRPCGSKSCTVSPERVYILMAGIFIMTGEWRWACLLLLCVDDTNFHCGSMAIYSLLCDGVVGHHFISVFSVLDC